MDSNRWIDIYMYFLSQGKAGQAKLRALAPVIQMMREQEAIDQANKDKRRAERNGFLSQIGGIGGQLGGMYMMGKMMAPAAAAPAAAAPVAAGSAPAVATPTLLGAKTVGAAPVAETSMLSSAGSVALPALAVIAGLSETWEGGAKDILRGRGNKQDWTNMGVNMLGGVGPNLVLRWMGKPSLGRMMTSGKSDDQLIRDDYRGALKEKGYVDNDYNITLADGSKFNIGLDGKTKYTNIDGKTTRNAYDVDLNNPLAQYAAKKLEPYLAEKFGKDGQNREQFVGMIVNGVTSNAKTQADVDANIAAFQGQKPATPPAQAPDQANGSIKGPATLPAPTPAQPNPAGQIVNQPRMSIGDILRPQSVPPPQPEPTPAPKANFMATPQPAPQPVAPPVPKVGANPMTPTMPTPQVGPQGLLALQQYAQSQPAGNNYSSLEEFLRALTQNGARA